MKVLYFHQHFSTPSGSTGIRSYEMAQRLLARGHQVTMVCGSYRGGVTGLTAPFVAGRRRGVVAGIDVIEFDLAYGNRDGFFLRTWTFIRFAIRSAWIAFSERYDVVFATTTPLTAGIPGILARWCRGKKFVFEVRDLWPELPRAMGVISNPAVLGTMALLEWVSYRSAHRLVALSPGIADGIARLGVPRDRITSVPNGCDLAIFGGDQSPWRPPGVSADDLLAVFTGTHGLANGLDAVLDAAVILKSRGRSDVKLLLIGDGQLKPALVSRAARESLSNVIFHDPVNKDSLARLMAAADVGMQILANVPAFYFGTSPNKFFDYLAAGIPVLINYPGWLAQVVDVAECGFVVPPSDSVKFADALVMAADNRELLIGMGKRARALAESNFDRAQLADRWVDWVVEGWQ
jgi:glycosyltransferase involved in cell wall biosynthesis